MRVSGNMVSNQIIENLNIDLARLQDVHNQVSTGKRINIPSDDPLGSQRLVNINEALSGIDQYQRNANYVTNWVSASEATLTGSVDSLQRANGLAIRAANDATLGPQELNALADEVNGILEQMVNVGNAQSEGKSLFAGYQTQNPAFNVTRVAGEITAVTYAGDNGVDQIAIDTGLTVNKNVPGSQIFQPAAGTDVFATLVNLRDAMRAGNAAAINAGITATSSAHKQIVTEISQLGNKTNMMDQASSNITAKKTALTKLNSQLGDVDMPEAIVRLQTAQNVYDAAMSSSARILSQSSLMDFLQ